MKFEPTFGILIAFLLPGFLCLYGLSFTFAGLSVFVPEGASAADFFYTALASLSLGLLISATRWAVLDTIFRFFDGMTWQENTNWEKLNEEKTLTSFQFIVQNHYHFYQYYSNSFVAILIAVLAYEGGPQTLGWYWLAVVVVLAILLIGSYDTLYRYFERGQKILGVKEQKQ